MTSQTLLVGFVGGTVIGQTMKKCDTHGQTNIIFAQRNGSVVEICLKCEYEDSLYKDGKD